MVLETMSNLQQKSEIFQRKPQVPRNQLRMAADSVSLATLHPSSEHLFEIPFLGQPVQQLQHVPLPARISNREELDVENRGNGLPMPSLEMTPESAKQTSDSFALGTQRDNFPTLDSPKIPKKKRKVACVECRRAKSVCKYDPEDLSSLPCKRCAKFGKECRIHTKSPSIVKPKAVKKSCEKALSDRKNRNKGKQCHRNQYCLRPLKHPGHCKFPKGFPKPAYSWRGKSKKRKIVKNNERE
eukprot:1372431-Amorphochlora_amoeboformis.AAC.1